jgi:secreted trypsin-like serine protease
MRHWVGTGISAVVVLFAATHGAVGQVQGRQCQSHRTKIVGGEAARIGEWPGQAAVRLHSDAGRVSRYFCGGTAISEQWVLTAAHCMPDYVSKLTGPLFDSGGKQHQGRLEVVLGASDLRSVLPEQVFAVEQVIMHETYRAAVTKALQITDPDQRDQALDNIPGEVGNDVALLRLARPSTRATAILSLAAATDPTNEGAQVRVAGYGTIEPRKPHDLASPLQHFPRADGKGELFAGSAHLRETAVQTIATPVCSKRYSGKVIGSGQICAGLEQGGKDGCQGDSGGPLVMMDAQGCPWQIGLVSWGYGCAAETYYGVYTRISAFADWIQKYTGPLRGASPLREPAAGAALTVAQLDEGLRQLKTLLGDSKGRVGIGIQGGNRVHLGQKVIFEAQSDLAGKLIVLDINANREVMLIYPNQFVAQGDIGRIKSSDRVAVPGPSYPGFSAFQAVEPVGRGSLLALVVPENFDIARFAADTSVLNKGFQPVNDPPSYLMRIIRQIEIALASRTRAEGSGSDELKHWGYATVEYEIVR